jgi:hypothetical protein
MLFADRTSTAFLRSNQIQLYFSSIAYLLMEVCFRQSCVTEQPGLLGVRIRRHAA